MGEEKKAKNEWVHFRELRARCPVCKKVAHVACKNGSAITEGATNQQQRRCAVRKPATSSFRSVTQQGQ